MDETSEVEQLLAPGAVAAVFQPIVRIADRCIIGYEALARFPSATVWRPPDEWFLIADTQGLRVELEVACWSAIADAGSPPDGGLLFVNTSPITLVDRRLEAVRSRLPDRLVIELTEQDAVDDYELLRNRLQHWSNDGVHLAIDDTGAGYSSLRHVLQLSPQFLKVDRSIISGVDVDRGRRALVWSLTAFAREVGATVIAEGVERPGELAVLQDAGVQLAQGWLFGKPGAPWVELDEPVVDAAAARRTTTSRRDPLSIAEQRFERAITAADDHTGAAVAACEHLFRLGQMQPSVFIERDGLLRCVAQRGYWQVLDGIELGVGIMSGAVQSCAAVLHRDVGAESEFLQAAPGIVDELAVPLMIDGAAVGALNVESLSRLTDDAIAAIERCADRLARRLDELGTRRTESSMHRLARTSKELAGLVDLDEVRKAVVGMALEVSQMDSAMLVQRCGDRLDAVATVGPLAVALGSMPLPDIELLAGMVDRVSSCYTAGDLTGRPVSGTESLRHAGAVEVAVVPLVSLGRRTGFLLVANRSSMQLSTDEIEPLELLAAEAARSLELAVTISELQRRAASDPLTGLGNHSAFYESLGDRTSACVVVMMDLDGFKGVNDRSGHVRGDRLLRDIANVLVAAIGTAGVVYRVGGDEFAAILPSVALATAHPIMSRACDAANLYLEPHGASISIGMVATSVDEAPTEAVERADQLLYESKRRGRGCVTAA